MTAKSDAWMPLYIGDYLADTGHLTGAEHGAYLLLLMQAWTRGGPLPAEDERLRALARLDRREWARARNAVLAFFERDGDVLRNPRLERELARVADVNSRRAQAGRIGAEKRWKNNGRPMANGMAKPMAKGMAKNGYPHPQLEPPKEIPPSPSFPNGKEVEGVSSAGAAEPPAGDGNGGKPPKPTRPEIPMALLNDMAVAWNAMARIHGLPQVSEVTPKRATALRARINERWRKDPIGMWSRYLDAIAATPFLRGENPRGWKANLDWAIRPESPVRVAEGRYSDDEGAD
jgi:uncharacterized protein YdaU (DUF1376 family)